MESWLLLDPKFLDEHPCTFILEVPPGMELQDKALKALTIRTFKDEIKAEIKEIRKEVEELKLSVKFVSASHDGF